MIKHKRKSRKQKKKLSKYKTINNPKKLFPNQDFIDAIVWGNSTSLSNALNFLALGGAKCKDCNRKYYDCTCEGSRNIIGAPCEDCDLNRCLCDLDIFNKDGDFDDEKIRKTAWKFAKSKLNDSELEDFVIDILNSDFEFYDSPFLWKLESTYQRNYINDLANILRKLK